MSEDAGSCIGGGDDVIYSALRKEERHPMPRRVPGSGYMDLLEPTLRAFVQGKVLSNSDNCLRHCERITI